MFVDFAELLAVDRQVMTMVEWLKHTKKFLDYTDQQILSNAGKISYQAALVKAHAEYDTYRVKQDVEFVSDFDEALAKYLKGRDET